MIIYKNGNKESYDNDERQVILKLIIFENFPDLTMEAKICKREVCSGKEHEYSNYILNVRAGKVSNTIIFGRETTRSHCCKAMIKGIKYAHSSKCQ